MTMLYAIARTAWLPAAVIAACAATVFLFANGGAALALGLACVLAFPLLWLYVRKTRKSPAVAVWVYAALSVQLILGVVGVPFSEAVILIASLFLPLIIALYLLGPGAKYIPGSGALALMVTGFLVSVVYQFLAAGGEYRYLFVYDWLFLLGIAAFFVIYVMLALGGITLRSTIVALTLSGLPLLVYTTVLYFTTGKTDLLFRERFGFSVFVSPNVTSSFLDLIFPLALFTAITERKRWVKAAFAALSLVYCLYLLLTFSRGSVPGLIIVLLYFIIRSKSVKTWIITAVVALAAGALFGEKIAARLVAPSRLDIYSNAGRVEMLRSGSRALQDNRFLFGIGMNNFSQEKFRYGFPAWYDTDKVMSSHNTFLEVWLGWGLIGLAGWLWLLVGTVIRTARSRPPPELTVYRVPFVIALVSFMLHGLFDSVIALLPFLVVLFSLVACMSFVISRGRAAAGLYKQGELAS